MSSTDKWAPKPVAGRTTTSDDSKGELMKRAHRVMVLGGIVAASIGATQVAFGGGSGSSGASALVSMVPCRLMDTRPAPLNVGPRSTPIAGNSTHTADVWGTNGNCRDPGDSDRHRRQRDRGQRHRRQLPHAVPGRR